MQREAFYLPLRVRMETEALFYSRPELFECDARALSIEDEANCYRVVLDRSLFYPEGGGQDCDLGSIGAIPLLAVSREAGVIVHSLSSKPPFSPGDIVRLCLDLPRRIDHTEQHSSQHLISSTLLRLFGMATKSVHVGLEHSTIDLAGPFLTASDAFEAEAVVNDAIAEGYNIITHECPPEDLASFPLRRRPPETDGVIRVVEIDGVDFTPCCGTHVRNTADLRLILFLGTERYKGMTRLFFVGGGRAVAAARASFRASREAGSILGVAYGDVGAEAGRVCARLKATQASMRSLVRARASTEAAAAIAAAPSAGPIVLCFQDRDADAVIEACKAMAERGRMAIAASVPDLTVCVASHDADARLNERLLPILTQLGGKGGGSESFFRAFFAKKPDFDEFLSIARKKLQN